MSRRLAILGAGDLGRQLAHHARAVPELQPEVFFDDLHRGKTVDGIEVRGGLDEAAAQYGRGRFDAALVAIGYRHPELRARTCESLLRAGIPLARLVHPSCHVDPTAELGEGAVLYPGCVVDQGVEIGANALLNLGCVIAHHSRVGDHSFLGPGVRLAGGVEVGAGSFLGIATVVIDHVRLGPSTRTGGGAVVVRDHPGHGLLVGVPASERRSRTAG